MDNKGGYRTKQLADWLGLSEVTIRQWTSGEWGDYLAPTAKGGSGRRRYFIEQDARIIALIATLKEQGEARDNIHATLKSLQADGWRELPSMPPAPPNVGPIPMIPRETADARIDTQRAALMREITIYQERVENLEKQLENEREHSAGLQQELMTAKEREGELRGKLEALESERKPTNYWIIGLAIVAVLVAVVTVYVVTLALSIKR